MRHASTSRAHRFAGRARLVVALIVAAPIVAAHTAESPVVRIATFNASLNRSTAGGLQQAVGTPDDPQIRAVAEIIQRVRPDVLLLQEFDFDAAGSSLRSFQANYLSRSQNGSRPIEFLHSFAAESNTGVPSGFDLNNDGQTGGGQDALGFGDFPGQYAMALLSRLPIETTRIRTFRKFLWRDMPRASLPDDPATAAAGDWYSREELAVLPLSSKSHWDIPVRLGAHTLHLLASHPTPPAFDGAEDRNGHRNHDEIRFWSDYLTPRQSRYIRDDRGRRGGLSGGLFVILGDQNSDPQDGASLNGAIRALLAHPRINATFVPASQGAAEASSEQGDANALQGGDPRFDTADFNDRVVGNLRVDYLLPSTGLRVCGGGVFWPAKSDPHAGLVWGDRPAPSSDHRLVWLDVTVAAARCPPDSGPTASSPSHPSH